MGPAPKGIGSGKIVKGFQEFSWSDNRLYVAAQAQKAPTDRIILPFSREIGPQATYPDAFHWLLKRTRIQKPQFQVPTPRGLRA